MFNDTWMCVHDRHVEGQDRGSARLSVDGVVYQLLGPPQPHLGSALINGWRQAGGGAGPGATYSSLLGPASSSLAPAPPGHGPHDTAAALDTCYTAPCPAHLPRPPWPLDTVTLSSGIVRPVFGGQRTCGSWAGSHGDPGSIHNTLGDTSSGPSLPPTSTPLQSPGNNRCRSLQSWSKLRSKLNQIHCHVMLWLMMFICTIVCGVSNEFCIGKAVSLTKVPLPVLTEYLAGCPKCEVWDDVSNTSSDYRLQTVLWSKHPTLDMQSV